MKRNSRYTMMQVYDSGNMNAGTSPIQITNNAFTVPGAIDALLVRVKTTLTLGTATGATGVITTGATISQVIQNIQLNDKANGVIMNTLGTDLYIEQYVRSFLDSRYYENQQRNFANVADAALANGSQEQDYLFKFPCKKKDLQLKIQGFISTLSTYLSTVGGSTMAVDIQIITITYAEDPMWTQRSQKTNTGAAVPVASNVDISKLLPDGVVIDLVALYVGTDSNVSNVTLDPTGTNTGVVAIDQVALTDEELLRSHYAVAALGSRISGLFVLDVGSFMKTTKTIFKANVGTGFTPYAFILYHEVSDVPEVPAAPATA